jgi:hypothetical protein
LHILIRLPALLADVGTAWLITVPLRAAPLRRRQLYAALYLFNPAVWFVSTIWGQHDSIYTFGLVAAVLLLERGRAQPAWLVWALAFAVKLQSVALLPLLLVVTAVRHGWGRLARGLAGALALWAALILPWVAAGRAGQLFQAVVTPFAPRVTAGAQNLWYVLLLGYPRNLSALEFPPGWPVPYRVISIGLFGAFVLIVLLLWRVNLPARLALFAALLSFGMFNLLTDMHSRYLFPTLALLLLALAQAQAARPAEEPLRTVPPYNRVLWWAFAAFSLTACYNQFGALLLVRLFQISPEMPGPYLAHRVVVLCVAAFHALLLAALTALAALQPRRLPASPAPP